MADIIKNGSFEYGTANSNGSRFIPTDWVVPNPYYSTRVTQVCDEDENNSSSVQITHSNWENSDPLHGYPDGLPLISIQQGLDLTGYNKELALNIEFNYSLAYNYYLTTNGELDVYLYRATSYDLDNGTYEYEGSYLDYISKNTYPMSRVSYTEMCWKTSHFIETNLEPGFYILVFATPVARSSQTGLSDPSYNFVLDKVSGTVTETGRQVIEYHNILKNGSFELQDELGLVDWFYHGITVGVGSADYYGNDANNSYGEYVCEASCNDLEYAKLNEQGLKQILNIDSYCKMKVSLDFQQYQNYPFALSVYKLLGYIEYDENNPAPKGEELPFWYATDENPYYQTDIRAYAPSDDTFSNWEEFEGSFGVEPGHYLLIIHPGEKTTVIDNVQINIYTEQETDHDGSFNNPFTLEDGFFSSDGRCFFFYDVNSENKTGFILRNEDYYYCESEVLLVDEIYNNRYYHSDGRMARFESFLYDGKLYTADMLGNLTLEENYLLDVVPYLDEKMIYGPIDSLDIIVGKTAKLYVKYMTQNSEIPLSVSSSNNNVVVCTGVSPGADRNVIELTGRGPGIANLEISFVNSDGSTISRRIKVIVLPNAAEYTNPYNVFLRKSVVCVLPGETVKLDYTTLPREAMAMAMYWYSSDENVATVDQNGNVTANNLGDCRIMIYNHRLKLTCYCEFYVIEQAAYPQKIKFKSSPPNSIQVGEEVRLPDFVLGNYSGNSNIVIQDGYWTSSNSAVLSISEYGTMVGKMMGEATITFRTPQNLDLMSSRSIEVTAPQIPIQDIELDVYDITLNEASPYGRFQINYRLVPANTNQPEVIWTSSNPDLVTVDSDGLVRVLKKAADGVRTVSIRCTSVSNSSVFKECVVTLDPDERYAHKVKTFTPRVTTVVDRPVNIEYEMVHCFSTNFNIAYSYAVDVSMESGSAAQEGSYSIEHREGSLISFSASVKGKYRIKLICNYSREGLSYDSTVTYGITYFYVEVGTQTGELIFLDNLETVSALGNGSYIARFFIRDNRDGALSFELDLGGSGAWMPIIAENLMYQGKMYNYIFGESLSVGTHLVRVRATDISSGESITSNVTTIIIPEISSDKRIALFEAKTGYDYVEYDIISYLDAIISDSRLYSDEILELKTRYKTYCHHYYNLREILEICIDHINREIAASQGQMAALSNTLSYGIRIASYSGNSNDTNSNYENVTDMDYYQNECIKQLVARVLELETKLNELTGNNN